MQLLPTQIERYCPESNIYNEVLSLDGSHILELGCGAADLTRAIATDGHDRVITATEVDQRQHDKNLLIDDLPNVTFIMAGAEAIPLEQESIDIVLMFKSLHHIPGDSLDKAMQEINRVLKPGGMAYISEPAYMGDFNDLIRLFHDEKFVREAAFATLKNAVSNGLFNLVDEIFFNSPIYFENFQDFENKVLKVTHTEHQLSDDTYSQVRQQFQRNLKQDGAHFTAPIRVDLLKKV